MPEPGERLRDKLIVAAIESLVIGALLVILGSWLNLRLETFKHELEIKSESNKALLLALSPLTDQRRAAYFDLRQAARKAESVLAIYYGSRSHERLDQLHELENALGIGSGGGSSSWMTNHEPIAVLRELILLRERYEDIASDGVKTAVDEFLDTLMKDLRAGAQRQDDKAFLASALLRLEAAFIKLNNVIGTAMQLDQLPIK